MKHCDRILACVLSTLFAVTVQAQSNADEAADKAASAATTDVAEAADIDPEALEIFKGMADHLEAADQFAYQAEYSYDAVQESGLKVEFGASRKILVSKPDRMRAESQRRDGLRAIIVFDGKKMWLHEPDENVYATADQPGHLDESIEFIVTGLRMKAPLADLIETGLYEKVTPTLTRALYLGETVVTGVDCEHLLMSNDYADFQMWITSGDQPVLKRIVITYREEPGQPQFRAHFLNWDMSPGDTQGKFEFTPPEDAERIRIYVPAPVTNIGTDQEDKS